MIDDDIMDTRLKQRFDLTTCISVIEHAMPPHESSVEAPHDLTCLLIIGRGRGADRVETSREPLYEERQ